MITNTSSKLSIQLHVFLNHLSYGETLKFLPHTEVAYEHAIYCVVMKSVKQATKLPLREVNQYVLLYLLKIRSFFLFLKYSHTRDAL